MSEDRAYGVFRKAEGVWPRVHTCTDYQEAQEQACQMRAVTGLPHRVKRLTVLYYLRLDSGKAVRDEG